MPEDLFNKESHENDAEIADDACFIEDVKAGISASGTAHFFDGAYTL